MTRIRLLALMAVSLAWALWTLRHGSAYDLGDPGEESLERHG